jgi:hypothetical protein
MPDVSKNQLVDDHISSARLPIVDISPYLQDGSSAEKLKTQQSLDSACREFGRCLGKSVTPFSYIDRFLLRDRSWPRARIPQVLVAERSSILPTSSGDEGVYPH